MANNFTKSEKHYDSQLASAYITYMMVGSFFGKSVCSNVLEETHLSLHYREMPQKQQLFKESEVLKMVENRLGSGFLSDMSQLWSEVTFRKRDEQYEIRFLTGGFRDVTALVERDGKISLSIS